ncbi:hypothetical protein AGLY_014200 [Aphis glycines]|uniref:PiggyBac transposable element-derived protein domain-containing protein n=1 Tax=Aphis glycines TaxID=307491 RepID=A0A6G0T4S0_APHGL|nr:hypothetical protein AGLY_014200 [Aphis glycines]
MMSSRAKKAKLNDDLINQILEIDNSSNSSEFSDFDDTDEDVTYNPNSSESDVESDVEESINDEKLDSSPASFSNTTRIEVWNYVTSKNRKQFLFNNAYSGLKIDIPPDSSALDIFKLFFTSEIIDLIVVETNRNAEQFLSKNRLSKFSRFAKWIPTNENEIQKFFGLIIWMGLVQMPTLEDYWCNSTRYKNYVAHKIIPRNRFELILRFLHFSDNEKFDGDKIYKVRNLVEKMIYNFQNVMEPDEDLAVDETMVPFRGRLGFRQYIPGKSHKYGVKLFKLCGTNGYTYNVQIYAGKSQVDGKGLACKVVLNLCQMYLNANRTITTDNFYTSLPLAYELLKNKTHLTGTLFFFFFFLF